MAMDVRLARIDDRLIHGQVATVWTKTTGINRILVVNDDVAKDTLRKNLLKQAAPPGVVANVITVQKMIDIWTNPKFDVFKAMLLFTNPHDVKTIIDGGVDLKSINIGGMSYSEGKKMVTTAIAVDDKDAECFEYLASKGIELDVRKVVADKQEDMITILKNKFYE
ncbi:PTS system, mannose-specific IIB component [Granulicatella balaenopterae]|uniref:PTS system, mannose-specific IIB component n=1 Tax=Granulicatella balaenopterae TaxID=137733 RepID=A0A1H9LRB6_9LACT|nr:mannose/fructose/sorbose PTS transporter subunit IIB [Granulicatella balaenopterae]SER13974.1 PTS system, mannose-specific IIB component [Granulicatella balaenopterae]